MLIGAEMRVCVCEAYVRGAATMKNLRQPGGCRCERRFSLFPEKGRVNNPALFLSGEGKMARWLVPASAGGMFELKPASNHFQLRPLAGASQSGGEPHAVQTLRDEGRCTPRRASAWSACASAGSKLSYFIFIP